MFSFLGSLAFGKLILEAQHFAIPIQWDPQIIFIIIIILPLKMPLNRNGKMLGLQHQPSKWPEIPGMNTQQWIIAGHNNLGSYKILFPPL